MAFETIDSMIIGYARVSPQEQTLQLQLDALEQSGCSKIFTDTAIGTTTKRKGLEEALAAVRAGDTLVVWRLDRIGTSLKQLIGMITDLTKRNIGFQSITEQIDTTTSGHIFAAFIAFERDRIRERTTAGRQAARARGKLGGRPKILDQKKVARAQALYDDKSNSIAQICRSLRISRATLYRYINTK